MLKMRRAAASEAKPLIGLYATSGAGKTKSALLLACGFVGGDMSRVVMVETESGRGEAYANDPVVGGYNVISLRENFAPKRYGEAIAEAESAGMDVLIIDSASHEWEGVGGVLAMAAENQAKEKKGPLIWQRPKMEHAREFMLRLTQTPVALVIVCMRARYPMYEVTAKHVAAWEEAGKPGGDRARPKVGEWARSWALEPKQSEEILFEMFVHGWIDERHALHVTKYTLDAEMRAVFADGEPITVDTGKRLAQWATSKPAPRGPSEPAAPITPAPDSPHEAVGPYIDATQKTTLERYLRQAKISIGELCAAAKCADIGLLPAADYDRAEQWIKKRIGASAPPP